MDAAEALAKELVNNHAKFDSFGWRDRPEDSHLWCVVYTTSRDADYLTRSNHKVFSKALAPFCGTVGEDEELGRVDCQVEHHRHWACGWIDGFSIRVYTTDGLLTLAFLAYAELETSRRDYPILDEEDASEAEREEADAVWKGCLSVRERIEWIRKGRFAWHDFADLLNCVRGKYAPNDECDGYHGLVTYG